MVLEWGKFLHFPSKWTPCSSNSKVSSVSRTCHVLFLICFHPFIHPPVYSLNRSNAKAIPTFRGFVMAAVHFQVPKMCGYTLNFLHPPPDWKPFEHSELSSPLPCPEGPALTGPWPCLRHNSYRPASALQASPFILVSWYSSDSLTAKWAAKEEVLLQRGDHQKPRGKQRLSVNPLGNLKGYGKLVQWSTTEPTSGFSSGWRIF